MTSFVKTNKMAVTRKRRGAEKTVITGGSDDENFEERIQRKEDILKAVFVPYEAKIMYLQGLLVWETPHYSAMFFAGVNLVFW